MKIRQIMPAAVLAAAVLFAGCSGYDSKDYGSANCGYSVSGDYSAMYSGDVTKVTSGMINYVCDAADDGYVNSYPQVTITLDTYTGPGTYDLTGAANHKIVFTYSMGGPTYTATGASTGCSAVFTSDTAATFACANIPKDGGGGTVSISSGSFSY